MSDTVLSQRSMPWGNQLLASTNLYIHAVGCFITCIAQIVSVTPDVVNDKLKAVGGFTEDGQVIWAKVTEAFPDFIFTYYQAYNNDVALAAIQDGKKVIAEVSAAPIGGAGLHAIVYIGNQQCEDPWTGTVRPTSDFPDVKAMVLVDKVATPPAPTPPGESKAPAVENMYQGLNINDEASVKAAVDTWKAVEEGQYVTADEYVKFTNGVCQALGIDQSSDLTKIQESIKTLKDDFAQQVAAAAPLPTPAQVEGTGPSVTPTPATLASLPESEKQKIVNHAQEFLASLKNLFDLN